MRVATLTATAALALITACSNGGGKTPTGAPSTPPASNIPASASFSGPAGTRSATHVFVLVFENKSYDQVANDPSAPYFNQLAQQGGIATNYSAITHPSLPNYLTMVGGSTFGITDDCTSCSVSDRNLADQLEVKGLTWKTYQDGMPTACYTGPGSGNYAKKHNPFVYFTDVSSNTQRCRSHIVPLTDLPRDLSAGTIANFNFITPDLCHDMHDCSVAEGDAWLHDFLPQILSSAAYRNGGIVIVTFDEGRKKQNQVVTIVLSAKTTAGKRFDGAVDHYSLLKTFEDLFGLPYLGHAADPGKLTLAPLLS